MSVWDNLTGQADAIAIFRAAAEPRQSAADTPASTTGGSAAADTGTARGTSASSASASSASASMTHAWLITGPPGSGRSNLAFAFAAALLSPGTPAEDATAERLVEARTHPDLVVLATEGVIIKMESVKEAVKRSQYSPSVGRYRVIVVEDADRMVERTSNVLLKALEEPPERTVWILCAPSEADLLPTIRSRVRTVRLRVPSVADVAALLVAREGVDPAIAERCAREAQSHIGMARRLATNPEARERREETLKAALGIRGVSYAVNAAARLLAIAGDDAKAITLERDAAERESVLRSLGVEPGKSVPPALRGQIKALEDDQKRRATRSLRDGIDRILVDLTSLYRDVIMVQFGRENEVINRELLVGVRAAAAACATVTTLATLDAIAIARQRIESNVAPALALEAMLVSAIRR
ncbi:DNA polymerase III subunit delta' [Cryobacterium zhongshanensis]|uniref:DNA polymerase III subunit delta n=1 Tax=Cryobacterium zhongshanensis TaxID=2928153 RepID=A0AA41QYH7_9MICO|nr:DNA polymerase III subunit delta' [Cryobacterium zhongshanensis]MCI4658276.1 DNA polymerase III subunit delta' [Cryobacterium zhongshanensis]